MRSAGNFHPEWGYLAPAPSFMRTVRIALVATAIGAVAGAVVVVSLVERPGSSDSTAIAAHALLTKAPVITSPAAASRAAAPAVAKSASASAQPQVQLSVATAAPSAPPAAATPAPKATPSPSVPASPSVVARADTPDKAGSASPPLPLPAPTDATVAAAAPVAGTARVPAEADEATMAAPRDDDAASEPQAPAKKSTAKRRHYEPYRRQEATGPRNRWRENAGFGPLFRLFSFRTGSSYSSN